MGSLALNRAQFNTRRRVTRDSMPSLQAVAHEVTLIAMLYVINRSDGTHFRPAWDIDPDYAHGLRRAAEVGVELLAYRSDISPSGINLVERLEACC